MISGSNRIFYAALIAAFCGLAPLDSLRALEVTPDYHHLQGSAGQKLSRKFIVRNGDAVPQKISVSYEPRAENSAPSFISFSSSEFELKEGETREVLMTCRVPRETAGEIYGNLVVRSVPLAGGTYEIRMRPEVCLRIDGTQVSDVAFAGVSAVRSDAGIRIKANLINKGNMKLAPKLVAYLDGSLSSDRGQILSSGKSVFYPNEQGTFTGSLPLRGGQEASAKSLHSNGHQRVFVTAFYRDADGQIAKKTQSFTVEAKP